MSCGFVSSFTYFFFLFFLHFFKTIFNSDASRALESHLNHSMPLYFVSLYTLSAKNIQGIRSSQINGFMEELEHIMLKIIIFTSITDIAKKCHFHFHIKFIKMSKS